MTNIILEVELNIPDVLINPDGSIPDEVKKKIGDDVKYRLESTEFDGMKVNHAYKVNIIGERK